MKRWLKWMFGLLILGVGLWYLFLKEYHYQVSFTTKEPPGIVYKHLLNWDTFDESQQQLDLISSQPFSEINQKVLCNDSSFTYRWRIRKTANNKTKVTAYISDDINDLKQKMLVPFGSNEFVKRSVKNVKLVGDALVRNAKEYKVHSIEQGELPAAFCAYLPLETKMKMKATTMLKNIAVIMEYLNTNNIPLAGDPFLEVTEWNTAEDAIKFNFCFPIKKTDSLPQHSEVRFKTMALRKGIIAEFNGNYRISQNAWYYLIDYAKVNGLSVEPTPIEIFMNDPHEGGNPLEWKALIFLPLKD